MQISSFRPTKPFSNAFFEQVNNENRNVEQQGNPILSTENPILLKQQKHQNQENLNAQHTSTPSKEQSFTELSSSLQTNQLMDYYNMFKAQIQYLFIIQSRVKLFQVLRVCKKLCLESTYFTRKDAPHLGIGLNKDQLELWSSLLKNISGSYVGGMTVANVDYFYQASITKQIAQKTFPFMKQLILTTVQISSLQFVSFMNVPCLETLQIYDSHITQLKALSRMNNMHLKQIMIVKSEVNEFGHLTRMRVDRSGSNSLKMRFWAIRCVQQKMNEINSFEFMYKLQMNDAIASISKCIQAYNKQLKTHQRQVNRARGGQVNMKPQMMHLHEVNFCKRFNAKKYKQLVKSRQLNNTMMQN